MPATTLGVQISLGKMVVITFNGKPRLTVWSNLLSTPTELVSTLVRNNLGGSDCSDTEDDLVSYPARWHKDRLLQATLDLVWRVFKRGGASLVKFFPLPLIKGKGDKGG